MKKILLVFILLTLTAKIFARAPMEDPYSGSIIDLATNHKILEVDYIKMCAENIELLEIITNNHIQK